jgi:hypothetical protein
VVGGETVSKYGRRHRAIRHALLLDAVGKPCVRCGRPIERGQAVDLDHHDDGRSYLGLAHATCNRRAGAERGNAIKRSRRSPIMKLSNVALGVEISNDRMHSAIAAAAAVDGRVAVALVEYLDGSDTAGAVAELAGRAVDLLGVVIDPRSPAATLIGPLESLGVVVTSVNTNQVAVAHGRFVDELRAGRLKIDGHPALDLAAQHALTRPLAGAEALERRKPVVDTSPLVAAELAVWKVLYGADDVYRGTFTDLDEVMLDDVIGEIRT